MRRAAAGDAAAEATLARYEDRMARALAGVINILDPDVIVLGGGMSNLARLYKAVPRLWTEYAFSDRVDTPLRAAVHGDSSGVRGAAWLWPGRSIVADDRRWQTDLGGSLYSANPGRSISVFCCCCFTRTKAASTWPDTPPVPTGCTRTTS